MLKQTKKLFAITAMVGIMAPSFLFLAQNSTRHGGEGNVANASRGNIFGVNFSQTQAEYLGLDWKRAYLAILDDLKAGSIKLITNWNQAESKENKYDFEDIDWQVKRAEEREVSLIYVVGLKTGRWPECHTPKWAIAKSREEQQAKILEYMEQSVLRYRDSEAIKYWQIENEPLFVFGECPAWYYQDESFLKTQVELVRRLDPSRKIIISDSGERSDWRKAAALGDVVGITMYRNAWTGVAESFGFQSYSFLDPGFYRQKARAIKEEFDKDVICVELQAEPWASEPIMRAPLQEQLNSMNAKMLSENAEFAKNTGLGYFYFWGAEWWYWMKQEKGHPEIWETAKRILSEQ